MERALKLALVKDDSWSLDKAPLLLATWQLITHNQERLSFHRLHWSLRVGKEDGKEELFLQFISKYILAKLTF